MMVIANVGDEKDTIISLKKNIPGRTDVGFITYEPASKF